MELKPFVKWAGGKRGIMDELEKRLPKSYNNYYEPFLGGGSVLLKVLSISAGKHLCVSDISEPLVLTYKTIKIAVKELIEELSQDKYQWTTHEEAKSLYLSNRDRFNKLKIWTYADSVSDILEKYKIDMETLCEEAMQKTKTAIGKEVVKRFSESTPLSLFDVLTQEQQVEMAALFIFLNKVGFNGMYRENGYGLYNIPPGRTATKPTIFTESHLIGLSEAFKNVTFSCGDYSVLLGKAKEGDFVYLDPPYDGDGEMFTSYSKSTFGQKEQENLKNEVERLHKLGCKVMLSNSATKRIMDWYIAMCGFSIDTIDVKRFLGASKKSRGTVSQEYIIRNFR